MKRSIPSILLALIVGGLASFFAFPAFLVVVASVLTYWGVHLMTSRDLEKLDQAINPELPKTGIDIEAVKKRIQSIESSIQNLPPLLRPPVFGITKTAGEILEEIESHPETATAGKRFVSHYLESTEIIIDRYLYIKKNTRQIMEPTEQKLQTLLAKVSESFRTQRENLLEDDRLHLKTEMEVLEKTLDLES